MVEEISEQEARAQIETNLFGALWVTQAALPFLREQEEAATSSRCRRSGASRPSRVSASITPRSGGLEGISQALAQEVKEFEINVTLVEPGGFSTDWSGPSSKRSEPNPAYDALRERQQQWRASNVPGDPTASAAAIMRVVDADPPPLRVFFGAAPLGIAENDYEGRLATWREWQPVAELAQGGRPVAAAAAGQKPLARRVVGSARTGGLLGRSGGDRDGAVGDMRADRADGEGVVDRCAGVVDVADPGAVLADRALKVNRLLDASAHWW